MAIVSAKTGWLRKVFDRLMRYSHWIGIGLSIIVGLIFIISGLGKLLHQAEFLDVVLTNSFLTPTLVQVIAYGLPWIELIVGALLIIGILVKLMASLSLVLIAAFIANNGWLIARGLAYEPCSCFGVFERVFLSKLSTLESLFLDIGMLALALIILFYYPGDFRTVRPWFLRGGPPFK